MKTLKCDICEFETQGETFENWMNNLRTHYGENHMDFMMQKANLTGEEKMEGMNKWMEDKKYKINI